MSWIPSTVSRKAGKRQPQRAKAAVSTFNDYHGPADGDFARYVEELMQAAQQRQAQAALTAQNGAAAGAGSATRTPDAVWGRGADQARSPASTAARPPTPTRTGQTATSPAYDPVRKASSHTAEHAAGQPPMPGGIWHRPSGQEAPKSRKTPGAAAFVLFFMAAAILMFVRPETLPVLILAFAGWHIWRQVWGR